MNIVPCIIFFVLLSTELTTFYTKAFKAGNMRRAFYNVQGPS